MSSRTPRARPVSGQPASAGSRARRRFRDAAGEPLLGNGLYIMGTTAVTALLGLGFWLIAARVLPAVYVGRAAALVSAMLLVAVFTNLGLGQVLISRLGSRTAGTEWSLTVTTCLLLAGATSVVGGLIAALVLPVLVPDLRGDIGAATFVILPLGVASIACSQVLDFACIAERRARPSFWRNVAAAVLRLALIAGAAIGPLDNAVWLLSIWVASFVAIDIHGVVRMLPALDRGFAASVRGYRGEVAEIRRLIAGHQSINLGSQASAYLLPVIVSARLGPTDNAYFYATFMLATGLFFIAPAIGNSLFAESAHHLDRLHQHLLRAARYVAIIATPAAVVLLAAGPTLLGIFGADYADAGTGLLYVLVGSAIFDGGYQLAIAVLRARGHLGEAAIASWTLLIACIASAWLLLPPLGLVGAGVGWCIGKAGGLLVALVLLARSREGRAGASGGPRRA